jgi:hypothetical protein
MIEINTPNACCPMHSVPARPAIMSVSYAVLRRRWRALIRGDSQGAASAYGRYVKSK